MTQNTTIQEALNMIDRFDWYWRMADSGYDWRYNAAKAGMRKFVALVSTIDNEIVKKALRNLWTLKFEEARDAMNGKNTDNSEKKNEYMAALAA
jgi:hypothetical protein